MKKLFLVTILGLSALMIVLAGCTWSTAGQFNAAQAVIRATDAAEAASMPVAFDQGKYDHGETVYLKQYCSSCHTLSVINAGGTFGPTHDHIGTTAAQRVSDSAYGGTATDATGYIYESLIDPEIYIAPGFAATRHHMPPYGHLVEEDLNDLVYFLANQE
jgi:cytochrome c2